MNKVSVKLTVFFEEPFWVGVFEEISKESLSVCKVVFGAEPKDFEVLEFILKNYYKLKFSPCVSVAVRKVADNPKRRQKMARKQIQSSGIGTKSQQAIQKMREESKNKRKQKSREQKLADKQYKFELKQEKKKQKHKGR